MCNFPLVQSQINVRVNTAYRTNVLVVIYYNLADKNNT